MAVPSENAVFMACLYFEGTRYMRRFGLRGRYVADQNVTYPQRAFSRYAATGPSTCYGRLAGSLRAFGAQICSLRTPRAVFCTACWGFARTGLLVDAAEEVGSALRFAAGGKPVRAASYLRKKQIWVRCGELLRVRGQGAAWRRGVYEARAYEVRIVDAAEEVGLALRFAAGGKPVRAASYVRQEAGLVRAASYLAVRSNRAARRRDVTGAQAPEPCCLAASC